MRPILFSLLFAVVSVHAQEAGEAPANEAKTAAEHYAAGVAAERAGDPDAARDAYTRALRVNPRHAESRYRLGLLKSQGANIASKGRETKIGSVMIPEIKLDGATLGETLELLGKLVEKHSEGKVTPNFVLQDPSGELRDQTVSLQLKNVPARAVLQYVTTQTGTKARFDEHAVVILPR